MITNLIIETEDRVKIAALLYSEELPQAKRCFIIVPGFASHSLLPNMVAMSRAIHAQLIDVLCLDPRGNGQSHGRFSFGAEEYLDVQAALKWAADRYDEIFLMGLSLGAYHSLRAVSDSQVQIKHLFLVSCPTRVDDIFWHGHAVKHFTCQLLSLNFFRKKRSLWFKWAYPFKKKPSARNMAEGYKGSVSFLTGEKDYLVPRGMTHKVFEAIPHQQKTYTSLDGSFHADELFAKHEDLFLGWIKQGMS